METRLAGGGNRRGGHHRLWIVLAAAAASLIAVRLALTPLLLRYVNQKLDEIPGYSGHVGDLDIRLLRGAYRIEDVSLEKTSGDVPVPFFKARAVDLSVEWPRLLDGSLVGEIEALGPELNFVADPPKAKGGSGQTSIDASWTDKVEALFPFEINRFRIREGQIHFRDFHREPRVDIHLDHIEAEARGLTNAGTPADSLPASFNAVARAMGHAEVRIDMRIAPLAETPTFDLDAELEGLRLPELNGFFRAYANVDVEAGTFGLYTEAAAAGGRFKGYVQPMMKGLEILDLEDEEDGPLKLMWEALVAGVSEVLENQPEEQVATRIPIEGSIEGPKAGLWPTAANLLRNAFLEALRPSLSHSIGLGDVEKKEEGGKGNGGG
jgi:hypothetical protein